MILKLIFPGMKVLTTPPIQIVQIENIYANLMIDVKKSDDYPQ
jgi:hypothetical protein